MRRWVLVTSLFCAFLSALFAAARGAVTLARVPGLAVALLVCLLSLSTYAVDDEQFHFRAGLCISRSRPLTAAQVQNLLAGLRFKTGLIKMYFDKDGFLDPGDRAHFEGGSPTARALLLAAVDGRNCFKLENHEYSASIAFAQIRATEVLIEDATQTRHEVFHIEFDFHDFRELRGNDDVLAAFDPAIHLLHELGHGALGLRDTIGRTDLLGDCERHINQVRRELGLPERQRYESQTTMAVIPGDTFTSQKAQLTFIRSEDDGRKTKEFPLYFKADNVYLAKTPKGGPQAGRCAALQASRR